MLEQFSCVPLVRMIGPKSNLQKFEFPLKNFLLS